jgi:hypothetical protein
MTLSLEMCLHISRGLREQASVEGREPKHLQYAKPQDDLAKVVDFIAVFASFLYCVVTNSKMHETSM